MHDTMHDLPRLVDRELPDTSPLRQTMTATAVFWQELAKWTALLLALAIASMPWRRLGVDLFMIVTLAITVSAFPAGLAVATRAIATRRARIDALLLSALLLGSTSIAVNGFLAPDIYQRSGVSGRDWRDMRLNEIDDVLRDLRIKNSRLNRELTILFRQQPDPLDRMAFYKLERDQDVLEGQIRSNGWLIQALRFHAQSVIAIAFLPLLGALLGYATGRWTRLLRRGVRTQIFAWSVALAAGWGTSYAWLIGYMLNSTPGPYFGPVRVVEAMLFVPTLMLILLAATLSVTQRHRVTAAPN
jgi:hypothetical protein